MTTAIEIEQLPDGRLAVTIDSLVDVCREKASAVDEIGWEVLAYQGQTPGFVLTALAEGLAALSGQERLPVSASVTRVEVRDGRT
jgi:hypothetical protein